MPQQITLLEPPRGAIHQSAFLHSVLPHHTNLSLSHHKGFPGLMTGSPAGLQMVPQHHIHNIHGIPPPAQFTPIAAIDPTWDNLISRSTILATKAGVQHTNMLSQGYPLHGGVTAPTNPQKCLMAPASSAPPWALQAVPPRGYPRNLYHL